MSDENTSLEGSLDGYKQKIVPVNKLTLTLDRELIFTARTPRGYEIDFDPQQEWGCFPTEALLSALAGCLAIDVVSFLRKMKSEITEFRIDVEGERNPTPPQYYKSVDMVIKIKGKNIDTRKMDRAISLSKEKYCSVYHTLRSDLDYKVRYEIEEG